MPDLPADYLARIVRGPDDLDHVSDRLARAKAISDEHTTRGLPATVLHTEPVVGCAWCITVQQARGMETLLDAVRPFDDRDYEVPQLRSARLVLAVLMLDKET